MKVREIIAEGGTKKIRKSHKNSMMNITTYPSLNQSTGSAYMNYRYGVALAGAPEIPMPADNYIGGDPLLATYTQEEAEMMDYAAKQVGAGKGQKWSDNKSKELDSVNKNSAVPKRKKNKYGV
jgi:hypothetical protein